MAHVPGPPRDRTAARLTPPPSPRRRPCSSASCRAALRPGPPARAGLAPATRHSTSAPSSPSGTPASRATTPSSTTGARCSCCYRAAQLRLRASRCWSGPGGDARGAPPGRALCGLPRRAQACAPDQQQTPGRHPPGTTAGALDARHRPRARTLGRVRPRCHRPQRRLRLAPGARTAGGQAMREPHRPRWARSREPAGRALRSPNHESWRGALWTSKQVREAASPLPAPMAAMEGLPCRFRCLPPLWSNQVDPVWDRWLCWRLREGRSAQSGR